MKERKVAAIEEGRDSLENQGVGGCFLVAVGSPNRY